MRRERSYATIIPYGRDKPGRPKAGEEQEIPPDGDGPRNKGVVVIHEIRHRNLIP